MDQIRQKVTEKNLERNDMMTILLTTLAKKMILIEEPTATLVIIIMVNQQTKISVKWPHSFLYQIVATLTII